MFIIFYLTIDTEDHLGHRHFHQGLEVFSPFGLSPANFYSV